MQIGGVLLLEGEPLTREELLEQIRERLHLVPRYRQKLAYTVLDRGRPVWVDDPQFDPEFHVRHAALPAPGSFRQLELLTARIFSQPLDRSRPLWEMWLVEGLSEGGCALISKNHHALIDGISGVDLATVLFDLSPDPAPVVKEGRPWQPHREPSQLELLGTFVKGVVRSELRLGRKLLEMVERPDEAAEELKDAAQGLGELIWALLNPAPSSPLNVAIGPYRRIRLVPFALDEFKEIKNAFGGTVNDVVLTVTTGALRAFYRHRGLRTEGVELRALVPVSVRTASERGVLGNRIVAMRAPLPLYIEDPVKRMRFMTAAMADLKRSKQAVGAKVITEVQNFAPPTILAQASRIQFSTRLFNLIVTNVPGPQFPLYVRGRPMSAAYPVAFLPNNQALSVAIMSYNGGLNFSLLADFDAIPDVDVIAAGLEEEVRALLAAARKRTRAPQPSPKAAPVAS